MANVFMCHLEETLTRDGLMALKTMIHRAYVLSSTREAFSAECAKLRSIFSRLDYPMSLIASAINNFLFRNSSANKAERNNYDSSGASAREARQRRTMSKKNW